MAPWWVWSRWKTCWRSSAAKFPRSSRKRKRPWRRCPRASGGSKGTVSLADFNEALGLKLPAAEFDTIGGLVLNLFGSLPREGRTIAYDADDADDKLTFRVLRMKGNRILEVEVRRVTP